MEKFSSIHRNAGKARVVSQYIPSLSNMTDKIVSHAIEQGIDFLFANRLSGQVTHSFADATATLSPGEHTVSAVAVGWDYSLRYITFPLIVGGTTCPPLTSDGLNVCSPITESTTTSPVLAWAGGNATGEGNLVRMEVWVDFVKQFSTFGSNQLKTSIVLSSGIHRFDYFLVSSYGIKWQQTVYTNVK